jgi:hypothetical protein
VVTNASSSEGSQPQDCFVRASKRDFIETDELAPGGPAIGFLPIRGNRAGGCNQLINEAAHAWLGLNGPHEANDVTEESKGAFIDTAG